MPEGSYNVGMTVSEFDELIRLIDEIPVNEFVLAGIRKKLVAKRKLARQRTTEERNGPESVSC